MEVPHNKLTNPNPTHLDNGLRWVRFKIDPLKFELGWVKPMGYPIQPKFVSKLYSFMKGINMQFYKFLQKLQNAPQKISKFTKTSLNHNI